MGRLALFISVILLFSGNAFGDTYSLKIDRTIDSLEMKLTTLSGNDKLEVVGVLCEKYISKNHVAKAQVLINQGISLANELEHQKGLAGVLYCQGELFHGAEKHQDALIVYNKALKLYEEQENAFGIAKCIDRIGDVYYSFSEYDKCIEYSLKAIEIFESLNDQDRIRLPLNTLGEAYGTVGRYYESMEIFQKVLTLDEELGDLCNETITLNNIGIIHYYLQNFDEALNYYKVAMDLIERDSSCYQCYAKLLNNIGNIYFIQNEDARAMEYFRKALREFGRIGKQWDIGNTLNNLGLLYLKNGKYDNAEDCLEKSARLAEELESAGLLLSNYDCFSGLYEAKGDYLRALEYHKMHTHLKDSLFDERQNFDIAHLKKKYEKEKELRELSIRNDKIEIQRIWLGISAFGIILISVFSSLLFLRNRDINLANKNLVAKNLEIIESEKKLLATINSPQAIEETVKVEVSDSDDKQKTDTGAKYEHSHLSDDQRGSILAALSELMIKKTMFFDDNLNLEILATRLGTNKNYLSQIINEEFNTSFRQFLNEFRIKEARRLLSLPENDILKIEAISDMVGFKSKSTFNRLFKEITGITPSFFKDNASKNWDTLK